MLKVGADSLLGRLVLAVQQERPWLRIAVSPTWVRVLTVAGARPALATDSMTAAFSHVETHPQPEDADENSAALETELRRQIHNWASYSAKDRIEFRTHTAPNYSRPSQCTCVEAQTYALKLISVHVSAINRIVNRPVGVIIGDPETVRDAQNAARQLLYNLTNALNPTATSTPPFDVNVVLIRNLVHAIAYILGKSRALRNAYNIATSLADDLDELNRTLNDVIGADLREVDLHDLRLKGLRWSDETRWPEDWLEPIHRASVELETGIFIVQNEVTFHG
jgi:hypothetical protein